MKDFDRIRESVLGLPPCCAQCHRSGRLEHVRIDGVPARLCCSVRAILAVRWPGSVTDGPSVAKAVIRRDVRRWRATAEV